MHKKPLKKMSAHMGPNMTPMVDVVMCILIFFMLGSSFIQAELFLKSNTSAIDKGGLGNEKSDQKLPSVVAKILVRRQGNDTWVSAFDSPLMQMSKLDDTDQTNNTAIYNRLAERRKSISDDVQVLIVPEGRVPYQDVITLYDFCTKLAFKQVAFYPAK